MSVNARTPLDEACCRLAQNDETLTCLDLDHNQIDDDGVKPLAETLESNRTLRTLNIYGNRVGDDGVKAIADALETNSTLTELDLSCNQIGNDGVKSLAKALKTNAVLRWLSLRHNHIGNDGARALLRTLQEHNGSLTYLHLGRNVFSKKLKSEIQSLVEQNENKTRCTPPRPLTWRKEELLRIAAANGNLKKIRHLLDDATNVNAIDRDGSTALYHASQYGRVDAAKLLMEHGAEVDSRGKGGKTPLMVASKNGHGDVVRLLLENGADADLKIGRFQKYSALDMAEQRGHFHVVSILLSSYNQKQQNARTSS